MGQFRDMTFESCKISYFSVNENFLTMHQSTVHNSALLAVHYEYKCCSKSFAALWWRWWRRKIFDFVASIQWTITTERTHWAQMQLEYCCQTVWSALKRMAVAALQWPDSIAFYLSWDWEQRNATTRLILINFRNFPLKPPNKILYALSPYERASIFNSINACNSSRSLAINSMVSYSALHCRIYGGY